MSRMSCCRSQGIMLGHQDHTVSCRAVLHLHAQALSHPAELTSIPHKTRFWRASRDICLWQVQLQIASWVLKYVHQCIRLCRVQILGLVSSVYAALHLNISKGARACHLSDRTKIRPQLQALPRMKTFGQQYNIAIPPLVYLLDQQTGSCQPNITDAELASLPALGVNYIGPWKVCP